MAPLGGSASSSAFSTAEPADSAIKLVRETRSLCPRYLIGSLVPLTKNFNLKNKMIERMLKKFA